MVHPSPSWQSENNLPSFVASIIHHLWSPLSVIVRCYIGTKMTIVARHPHELKRQYQAIWSHCNCTCHQHFHLSILGSVKRSLHWETQYQTQDVRVRKSVTRSAALGQFWLCNFQTSLTKHMHWLWEKEKENRPPWHLHISRASQVTFSSSIANPEALIVEVQSS